MKTRIENWNGHEIRFVEVESGEWWAVAKDVSLALGYRDTFNMARILDFEEKDTHKVSTPGGVQKMVIISEAGIYEAIFNSRSQEAKAFKKWVKEVIKELRQQSGLEGFQVFRMLDKEHQKEAMKQLSKSLRKPKQVNFIKANTIANKAISTKYGYKKMIKKKNMTPDMLIERQPILEDTVNLMSVVDKFGFDISVSNEIYKKYVH